MKKPSLSLSGKFFLLVGVIVLPVIAGFTYNYIDNRRIIKEQILDGLTVIADAYEGQVYTFLEMSRRRVEDFSGDGFISDEVEKISTGKIDRSPALRTHLIKNKLRRGMHFKTLAVFTTGGRVAAATGPDIKIKNVKEAPFFKKATAGAAVTEGVLGPTGGQALILSAPVRSRKTGKTVGVIAGSIAFQELGAVLRGALSRELGAVTWNGGRGKTMEVYIVNSQGRLIAKSRPDPGTEKAGKIDTRPVRACLGSGREISAFFRDYRGELVAGASMCMPSLGWTLVVKYDAAEALSVVAVTKRTALFVALSVSGMIFLIFGAFSRTVVSQIKRISSAATAFAGGNYHVEMPVETNDEIGVLTRTFNRMATDIRTRKSELTKTLESLKKAQHVAGMGSWEWDLVKKSVMRSEEVYRIFGLKEEEFETTFDGFINSIHPDDREFLKRSVDDAIYKGKPYSVDYRVVRPDGEVRAVHGEAEVIFDGAGKPVKMVGTVQDITERQRGEEEKRKRFERITRQRAALVNITKRYITEEFGLEKSIRFVTETSAKTMDVERVGVWLLNHDNTELRCKDLFELTPARHSSGEFIKATDHPDYFKALESGRAIDAHDARSDRRTYRFKEIYLEPRNIFSMLDAPVRLSGRVIGVVCHEQVGCTRRWTEDEISFAADIADQVAKAILEDRRRSADTALRASESRYRTLFETANDAIVTMGEDGSVWSFNGAAEKMFGYSSKEIVGRDVKILMPERYRAHHDEAISNMVKTGYATTAGKTREYEALRKDGVEFPISITMTPARVGGGYIFLAIIRDITERKKREFELKKLSTAIEQGINAVFITDREGKIEYVNKTFEKITGYTRDDAIGQTPAMLSSGETLPRIYEELWNTILSGRNWQGVLKNRTKTGGHYWCNNVIFPIRDDSGEITHFMAMQEDITEKRASKERLEYFVSHDEVTGLLNRSNFLELLNLWISGDKKGDQKGVLFLIDIDRFKLINDTYGHAMGDIYLRRTGKLLYDAIVRLHKRYAGGGLTDPILARLSGDEYAAFIPDVGAGEAQEIAEELRRMVEGAHLAGGYVSLTLSTGIVLYPDHAAATGELLARADAAMYRAKDLGRNRFHLFSPEDRDLQKMHSRMEWKEKILKAIKEERFDPWFQPILDLGTGMVTHYEALARMRDEDGRILPPGAFIEVAENFGLIGSIDKMIIRKAVRLQRELKGQGKEVYFSLNLSGIDLGDENFLSFLKAELTGNDRPCVIFEVTETAAVKNIDEAVRFIKELKELGCKFSLDDFGVGFTSFVYLKEMDVDYIKIDGSFIRRLHENPQDQLFVRAMIDVAAGMEIKTVAEFVETVETLELLKRFKVDYAQGYFIGKPGPPHGLR